MRIHKSSSKLSNTILSRAINKYGWNNFRYEIIDNSNDKEKLLELEMYYIKYYNSKKPNGYNMTDGGEKLFGENNPFYNKKHSCDVKQKMSELAKQRLIELNPFYGMHHSEHAKDMIRIANSKSVVAFNSDGIIKRFTSLLEAGRWCIDNNLSKGKTPQSDISKACKNGKIKFGYYWKYLEEDVETMA